MLRARVRCLKKYVWSSWIDRSTKQNKNYQKNVPWRMSLRHFFLIVGMAYALSLKSLSANRYGENKVLR